ncbi:hypothetical protein B0T22DRAFT_489046 [Podospora appendiculata]|uniref:Uncharacterized protein n=1 Tax=Podospora appendiculata TaxID=314037 RepID=A0AAE1CII7_9PEZI|nr:hypothetical protein B0T22DRAFT_489046 [Podospora appendiculata]
MVSAGAITLADGIGSVADLAMLNLQSIKSARHEIHGATAPLNNIESEADLLLALLALIKATAALQTPSVAQQAYLVMGLASRLTGSMLTMGAENRRSPPRETPRELKPADHEYGHLETMLGQLRRAREALAELVCKVRVGLRGNARDGFWVTVAVVEGVNALVREAVGRDLEVWEVVGGRGGVDGLVKLDDADIEKLGLPRLAGSVVEKWRNDVGEETGISRDT